MRIATIVPGADGHATFGDVDIEHPGEGPFGLRLSEASASPGVQFVLLPPGTALPLHPVGRRLLIVVADGTLEVGTSDGASRTFSRGDIFLADDGGTLGHTTASLGGAQLLWMPMPEGIFRRQS